MPTMDEGKERNFDAFNQYMMHMLQSSEDLTKSLGPLKQQIVNFYIAIFTALVGGGILVATTVTDTSLKFSILALDLIITAGIGMLSYIWILNIAVSAVREGFFRVFLYKYFRDLSPSVFEKYGLEDSLTWYTRAFSRRDFIQAADLVTLFALAMFSSCLLAGAGYFLSSVATVGGGNILFSVGIGLACLVTTIALWLLAVKKMRAHRDTAHELFEMYHGDRTGSPKSNKMKSAP
jgi:hypothetical protein